MVRDERRREIRETLLRRAREDERITGAAITGSAARNGEDRWSDVDLFFGVATGHRVSDTLANWSDFVYREFAAIHHFDGDSGVAIYRAFLLDDLLEVDLGFTPAAAFGPLGGGDFQLVFGDAVPRQRRPADLDQLAGHAWHHVLHARISIERGSVWQAEHWISRLRNNTLTMACERLGLPTDYNKHVDNLPIDVTGFAREALVRDLRTSELSRALRAAIRAAIRELHESHLEMARTLEKPLLELSEGDLP